MPVSQKTARRSLREEEDDVDEIDDTGSDGCGAARGDGDRFVGVVADEHESVPAGFVHNRRIVHGRLLARVCQRP